MCVTSFIHFLAAKPFRGQNSQNKVSAVSCTFCGMSYSLSPLLSGIAEENFFLSPLSL